MFGVAAMAVQNALVRISISGAPSTAVMTTNVTHFMLDQKSASSAPSPIGLALKSHQLADAERLVGALRSTAPARLFGLRLWSSVCLALYMVGTVIGAVAIVVLTAFFPQDRAAFLVSLALWGAVCALVATLLRNFVAYAAALAGFTAAIIASDQLGATIGGPPASTRGHNVSL
jgi:uncharacterized membrane protein YccC